MPDFRVFCEPTSAEPATLTLSPEESRHLVAVNRAHLGDTVVAFDGRGNEWIGELADTSKTAAVLRVRFAQKIPPLPYAITLGQALPKGDSMERIVRKATEIGTARIVPLQSERTQVHLAPDRQDKKHDKWRIAALEAAKQCGNAYLPEIAPLQTATAFMEATATASSQSAPGTHRYDLKLIASLQPGAKSLKSVLADFATVHSGQTPRKVLWLIGPEGDFTPAEMSAAASCGFTPVTLGPLVLRCETAAIYALSILSYELQNG